MTTSKTLPARPSLESLRKQARRLARGIAAGSGDAIARLRAQLPHAELPLSHRDAQLVLAREYGFAGWQDLTAEVFKRIGKGVEWAAGKAQQLIHANDVEGLRRLLAEYPALLEWRGDGGGLLASAVSSYGDSFDPAREQNFTRRECAEVLIDSGVYVDPSLCDGLIVSRARGMMQLFDRKGLLPHTLGFLAALGDLDGVRACFDEGANEVAAVNQAFMTACHFEQEAVALFLLDRCIELNAELGKQIEGSRGRAAFVKYLIEEHPLGFTHAAPADPRQAFVMSQVVRAIHEDDLAAFARVLQAESWMLGEGCVPFQVGLIERATLRDRGAYITRLLDLAPALLRRQPPPQSQAIEFAFTYATPHLVPLLIRVWRPPDDLPHAAGIGDFARVKRWFDEDEPALRQRDPSGLQPILDHALAWAVLNRHFEVAAFLLEHGADINTRWSSHEPASLLHELVFRDNREGMQFLIDRGIDMTIRDHRWGATAEGWARYGAGNEKLADWLAAEYRRRI